MSGQTSAPKTTHSRRRQRRTGSAAPTTTGSELVGEANQDAPVLHLEIRLLRLDYSGLRVADPIAQAKLLASIAKEGQKVPIIVVREEDDQYQVLDGFQRREALEQLGEDVIVGIEWPTGAVEGLVELRRLRTASRAGPLEEGWLVEVLADRHALSLAEIGLRLNKTKSWVCRRLALVRQLPEAVREKVLTGALSGYIATKFAVPLARANAGLVAAYCDCVIAHELTTRQAGLVYQALARTTDPKVQKEILSRPQRVLEPTDGGSRAGQGSGPGADALDVVDRLEGWCRHTGSVRNTITKALVTGQSEDSICRLVSSWRDHREMTRSLLRQLDELAALVPVPEVLARANATSSSKTKEEPC